MVSIRTGGWPLRPRAGFAPTWAMRWVSSWELAMRIGGLLGLVLLVPWAMGSPAASRLAAIAALAGTRATSTRSAPRVLGRRRPVGSRSSGLINPASNRSESQVRLWVHSKGTLGFASLRWLPGWRRSASIASAGTR